jgi:protein O-mannosyl-transferase
LSLREPHRTLLISLGLMGLTLLVYWPQTGHDFITYDDPFYLTDNARVQQGLTWANVAWAFRTGEAGNWHPLTWLSHMLDVQLFGLNAGWHHLVSLVFHIANSLLLFALLRKLKEPGVRNAECGGRSQGNGAWDWRCAFVAALFALHPLHVQSVAWASERKDVLSAFFFLLTLGAYVRYAEKASCAGKAKGLRLKAKGVSGQVGAGGTADQTNPHQPQAQDDAPRTTHHAPRFTFHASLFYLLSLVFFALGLMSKPMLVTTPFVLLLLDVWPLRRWQFSAAERSSRLWPLLWEKVPFLVLAAGSCVVTLWAQSGGGAVVPMGVLSLPQRLANALIAYAAYLGKTFWPVHLAVLYPFGSLSVGAVIVSSALLVAVTGLVVWRRRSQPYLAVGWFWFLGMLVPVIGLVQVGLQQMADRYTYLPLIGLFVMLAWGVPDLLGRWRGARGWLAAVAALAVAASAFATSRELAYWQNSERLFGRALEVGPANYIALYNYGRALLKQGKLPEAVSAFTTAVQLRPELDAARCDLGTALMEQGHYDEAAAQFNRVLAQQPDHVIARLQLGLVLGRQGKLAEAEDAFRRVLKLQPDEATAHNNLGNVLALENKPQEAVPHFEAAVRLRPDNASAHNNLAISCRKLGRIDEAIAHYREAIRLQPEGLQAINNLAWLLAAEPEARYRNGAEAVALATRACELTKYENPLPLATLAVAFAETGQFPEAVAYAERAQELAGPGQSALAARAAKMLAAFRAHQPYHGE